MIGTGGTAGPDRMEGPAGVDDVDGPDGACIARGARDAGGARRVHGVHVVGGADGADGRAGVLPAGLPGRPAAVAPCVVLCDLDGVVWLSNRPIPGSVAAVTSLRRSGHRVLFVTNNSSALIATQEQALADIGIPAQGDVLTSAQAAAQLMLAGQTAYVCGGEGIVEALAARGVEVRAEGPVDAVLVGFHRDFDYAGLTRASAAVRRGARLIGTNDDATYPTPEGPIPGGGAILAAVVTASGVVAEVAGKPYGPMAALVRQAVGPTAAGSALMVGDRPDTDGRFAATLGCRFALVYTGVTPRGAEVTPPPDMIADDLAAVVELLSSASASAR